nr:hypothetical protein [uncultured Capnocytophaga sp.]
MPCQDSGFRYVRFFREKKHGTYYYFALCFVGHSANRLTFLLQLAEAYNYITNERI